MTRSAAPVEPDEESIPLSRAAKEIGLSHKALYNRCHEGYVEHFSFRRPGPRSRASISVPRREIERLKREAHRPRITETERAKSIREAKAPAKSKPKPTTRKRGA